MKKISLLFDKILVSSNNLDEHYVTGEPFKGYTLFGPMWDTNTFLINNNGKVVYTWKSQYADSQAVYILENGNLVRTSLASSPIFSGGAQGRTEMLNSEGDKIWNFIYASDQYNHSPWARDFATKFMGEWPLPFIGIHCALGMGSFEAMGLLVLDID